ncbi:MAG: Ig-like domain-containing protein, partial [Patescibacteria group bacterium]
GITGPEQTNAEMNWWGVETGPTAEMVYANVDFRPWCVEEACTTVDADSPTTTITSSATSPTNLPVIPFIITFSEAVTDFTADDIVVANGIKGTLDGSSLTYTIDITPVDQGAVTVNVDAEVVWDASGNYNTVATPFSITYDSAAPIATVAYSTEVLTNQDVTATMTANETVTVTSEGGLSHVFTDNGSFNFTFVDTAGNTGSVTATVANIDKTLPIVEINSPGLEAKVNGNTKITFTTDENSPQCSVNNTNWITCVSNTTILDGITGFAELPQGTFNLYLRDTDAASNIGTDIVSLTKDTVSPTVVSHVPTINAVNVEPDNDIVITFSEAVIVETGDVTFSPSITGNLEITGTDVITINPINPLESNTSYTITLSGVTDLAGNAMADYSNVKFTTATHYNVPLYSNVGGWNLISLPVVPNDKTTSVVLGAASQNIDAVWSFDPTNPNADESGWLMYSPNDPEGTRNLDQMTTGYGYWVSVTANTNISGWGSLLTAGPTVPPSRDLNSGWNLIGYYQIPGEDNSTPANAFSSLGGNYTGLWGFDNNGGVFKSLIDTILPGDAFWISLPAAKTYSPSNIR